MLGHRQVNVILHASTTPAVGLILLGYPGVHVQIWKGSGLDYP